MALADNFVTFEDSAENYVSYMPPEYATKHSISKFWHIVHSCSTQDLVTETLQRLCGREAKWLFMTDLTMPTPYCTLPSKQVRHHLLSQMPTFSACDALEDLA